MLKLGEKIINQIYLGDKKIAKVFLGDKLVFQDSQPIFLESIVFDGNSWIDTEIIPNNETGACIHLSRATDDDMVVLGCRENSSTASRFFPCSLGWGAVSYGWNDYNYIKPNGYNLKIDTNKFYQQYTNYLNNRIVRVVEKTINLDITSEELINLIYSPTLSMFLGCANVGGKPNYYFKGAVSRCVITQGEQIVRDLRPCLNHKGVICFYDMVTKKYFYNKGTGNFAVGGQFVESVVFNGNSCIDTGITFQSCTVETLIRFENNGARQLMGFSSSSGYWWGAETNGRINSIPNTNAFQINKVNVQWTINDTASTFDRTITVNDTYSITAKGLSLASPSTCKIGALSVNGKDYPLYGNVYYSKIYDANGELIQDLRPLVDENGVACFYDLITGNRFYNTGTGTLTYTE